MVALDGPALLWFQWEHRRRPIEKWDQVKLLLRRQFRSQSTGSLQEQWLAHRQGGSVTDYRLKFIELIAPLDNVSEEMSLGQFLNGLKEDIRAEVRLLGPVTVDHAMELAQMVENKIQCGKSKGESKAAFTPFVKAQGYTSSVVTSPRSYSGSLSPSTKSYASYSPSGVSTGSSPLPVARPVGNYVDYRRGNCKRSGRKGCVFVATENGELGTSVIKKS